MAYSKYLKGYTDLRTLYQTDSLYAWKHNSYFPPIIVEISPTHKCNQACRYCYAKKRGKDEDSLPEDVLIRVVSEIAQGTGEPLMNKAVPEAVKVGAKGGLSVGLTTNGVLLSPAIQERTLEHLFYVKFSVIDSDPKRYTFFHGCSEKQWQDLMRNIEHAVKLREKNGFSVALFATVYLSEHNFKEAYSVLNFFKQLGLDYIVLQEASYNDSSPCGRAPCASESFSADQIREMKEKLFTLNDDNFVVKIRFPINDDKFCVGIDKNNWKQNYCQGIRFSVAIASDGEVYPCWRMWGKKEFSYGNVREKSFEEIWKGEKRKEVEQFIGWYGKIKNINELESDSYWKRTVNNIRGIKERIINIAHKLQELEQ